MNDLAQIVEWVAALERDHKAHVAATKAMFRLGPVVARDKDKGARIQSDEGNGVEGKPHLENWGQPAERSGVERDVPRIGQHCAQIAPYGNPELGLLIPFGHNRDHPNPAADLDETVIFNRGKIRLSVDKTGKKLVFVNDTVIEIWEGAKKTVTVDGNTTVFEKDAITFPDGSNVKHGGRNIGKDHVHGGVRSGTDKSGDPDG